MKTHKNHLRLLILLLLVLLACVGYMTVGVHFENQKLFAYAMRIRTPKLIAMLITAFAICAFVDGKIAKFGTVQEVITKENLSDIYKVDFEIMQIEGKPLSIYY